MHSRGFTLVEVLVAVVIIVTVIGTMLQLLSGGTRFFAAAQEKSDLYGYSSLLLGRTDYGFERRGVTLDELAKEFNVDDELRRTLKLVKVEVDYTELGSLDGADLEAEAEAMGYDEALQEQTATQGVLEIGRTTLRGDAGATSFVRIRMQQ